MTKLIREDLRETLVCNFEHKGSKVEVYLIRRTMGGFRNAVAYTKLKGSSLLPDLFLGDQTFIENDIVGVDSSHGLFDRDWEHSFQHIGSVIDQIKGVIEQYNKATKRFEEK